MEKKKLVKTEIKVTCIRCNYFWIYTGKLASRPNQVKNRCRCPRCHSSQNSLNRKVFGEFVGL